MSTSGEIFGYYGYYEADAEASDTLYYYAAYNTYGDAYYGYAIADAGTYSVGSYYYATVYDNDGGYWYYYVYASADYGAETGYEGYSWVDTNTYYYDYDTGYGDASYVAYAGTTGIGSEYGQLDASGEYFGLFGYFEADAV